MYTRETKIRLTDFLLVLIKVKGQWKNMFKMLKKKILFFSNIANIRKLKEFITTRPVQQIMLKEFLQVEERYQMEMSTEYSNYIGNIKTLFLIISFLKCKLFKAKSNVEMITCRSKMYEGNSTNAN